MKKILIHETTMCWNTMYLMCRIKLQATNQKIFGLHISDERILFKINKDLWESTENRNRHKEGMKRLKKNLKKKSAQVSGKWKLEHQYDTITKPPEQVNVK